MTAIMLFLPLPAEHVADSWRPCPPSWDHSCFDGDGKLKVLYRPLFAHVRRAPDLSSRSSTRTIMLVQIRRVQAPRVFGLEADGYIVL